MAFAVGYAAPGKYPQAKVKLDTAVTDLIRTRLDAAFARVAAVQRPSLSEFDLVRGLAGLGAYLLQTPDAKLLRRVLSYLVRLTEPVRATDDAGSTAPGWWTGNPPPGYAAHAYPGGHADLGMAHGISGPLALLAISLRHGITVDGHTEAITRICRWLDAWRQDGPAGPWWPERIGLAELRARQPLHQTEPARPSWCYGTPGVARALQLAGIALNDSGRQHAAEQALLSCLADPAQLDRITGPGLCHGWAGVLAATASAAADARSGEVAGRLPHLLDRALSAQARAGATPRWRAAGLMDGGAGLALTVHTLTTPTTRSGWRRCLLLT